MENLHDKQMKEIGNVMKQIGNVYTTSVKQIGNVYTTSVQSKERHFHKRGESLHTTEALSMLIELAGPDSSPESNE